MKLTAVVTSCAWLEDRECAELQFDCDYFSFTISDQGDHIVLNDTVINVGYLIAVELEDSIEDNPVYYIPKEERD